MEWRSISPYTVIYLRDIEGKGALIRKSNLYSSAYFLLSFHLKLFQAKRTSWSAGLKTSSFNVLSARLHFHILYFLKKSYEGEKEQKKILIFKGII